MNDHDIKKAGKGILYMIITRLMDEFPAVEKLAGKKKWLEVMDDLEEEATEAVRNIVRPL